MVLTRKSDGLKWIAGPQGYVECTSHRGDQGAGHDVSVEYRHEDVGNLLMNADPDTTFLVASNFNALEFSYAEEIVESHSISSYCHDRTQGPRVQTACFPQLLARWAFYERQPEIAGHALQYGVTVAESGWLVIDEKAQMPPETYCGVIRPWAARSAVVCNGADYNTSLYAIADESVPPTPVWLVMSAAVDMSYHTSGGIAALQWAAYVLRVAYLGVFQHAIRVGSPRVVLTFIGGGVFRNPKTNIWIAMGWAAYHAPRSKLPKNIVIADIKADRFDTMAFPLLQGLINGELTLEKYNSAILGTRI